MRFNCLPVCIAAPLILVSVLPADVHACSAMLERFNQARAARDLPRIVRAVEAIGSATRLCTAKTREDAARLAALEHVREATRLARMGVPAARRLQLLYAGARLAQPWQLSAATGDILAESNGADGGPRYGEASLAYQRALDSIAGLGPNPQPPARATVERLLRLATQMRALSPTFVAGRSVLSRSPGGITVAAVPVPVQFHYKRPEPGHGTPDATDMTENGRRYAREAADLLKKDGMPRIRLVGHTDPVGGTSYNRGLGLRRAEALRRVLIEAGYDPRRIEVASQGEERPITIENAERFSEAERHAVLRRVEICFLETTVTGDCR